MCRNPTTICLCHLLRTAWMYMNTFWTGVRLLMIRRHQTMSNNLRPADTRYCYTLHMMDDRGDSVSVSKRCATLDDCLFAGCAHVTFDGHQVRGASAITWFIKRIENHRIVELNSSTCVRCVRPAVRATSATCWCRGTRAAPSSPPPPRWPARAGGMILRRWATSSSSSSSSSVSSQCLRWKLWHVIEDSFLG